MRFFSQSIFDDFVTHSSPGKTLTNHQWMVVIRQVSYMKDSSWLLSTTAVTHQTRKTTENLSKLKKNSTKHLSHAIFVWNHPQPNYARNSFDNRQSFACKTHQVQQCKERPCQQRKPSSPSRHKVNHASYKKPISFIYKTIFYIKNSNDLNSITTITIKCN